MGSFDVCFSYDTADKAQLEVPETCTNSLYPLYDLDTDVQEELGLYASFVRLYEEENARFSDQWEARRQELVTQGVPDDGTADSQVFLEIGCPEPSKTLCIPEEVKQWAERWLALLAGMSDEQQTALVWKQNSYLMPGGKGQEPQWHSLDAQIPVQIKGIGEDLRRVLRQATYALDNHIRLVCEVSIG